MAFTDDTLDRIRSRFAHVDTCPFQGERICFENAGGALTLNSVVETSTRFAAIPDNQGRDNVASKALVAVIDQARADARTFFNASQGQIFVGESGTELLFRLIRSACVAAEPGSVVGSTVEHPASRSAAAHWARETGKDYVAVPHDNETGSVSAEAYLRHIRPDTRVATILHCSPVTGVSNDLKAIAKAIRSVAPECFIIVDGIQYAAHGAIDIDGSDIDGYVISPYKVFSRHGYGIAWVSDRLGAARHESLDGGPALETEDRLRKQLAEDRRRDASDGRTSCGPHRTDLDVRHAEKKREAALCSTGEQKALLIALVLAHARMQGVERGASPVLLLDEVAAHLDQTRRSALFDLIDGLNAQAWMTGTDPDLFDGMQDRAGYYHVADGAVRALDA